MRLHHLRLRGIGPFAGDVTIDFAALGASGMFLLEGPTGSGKSTILDAIVYALYGTVAGAGASGDRIRSQFASPREASVVDLVFETSSGIYRVRREPEYQRAKLRGTGTTKEQAKALLWRLGSPALIPEVVADRAGAGGGVEPIAMRLDEVGREIQRAVGLTREQFTQTVLLPQNEFARFLRASSGDRQQVLQRVFGTEIYQDVEKQLGEMRKGAKRQVDEARGVLGQSLARFGEAAGLEDEDRKQLDAWADLMQLDAITEAAAARTEALTAEAETVAQQASARAQAETAARTAAETSRSQRDLILRRRQLDALAAQLEQSAPAAQDAQRSLLGHEHARPVAALLARRDTALQEAGDRERALDQLRERTAGEHPDLTALLTAEDPAAALAEASQSAASSAGELTALAEAEKALPAREQSLGARLSQLTALESDLEALGTQIAARPEARAALLTQRDAARAAASGLGDARLAEQSATARRDAATKAQAHRPVLERAADAAGAALSAAARALEAEADLRRRRIAGIAAELAQQLEPGESCPVCGSTEHPAPAAPSDDAVSAEQVENAEAARQAADAALAAAQQKHALALQELEELTARAGGLALPDAQTALAQASAVVASAQKAQGEAAAAETAIEKHDDATSALVQQREKTALALETQRTEAAALRTSLEEDQARVAAGRGAHESVLARRAEHQERARAASALATSLRERDQARQRAAALAEESAQSRAAASAQLADALRVAGISGDADAGPAAADPFAQEPSVHAAVLEPRTQRELTALLEKHRLDSARLAEGMAQEGIAGVESSDEALSGAEAALEQSTAQLALAQQAARDAAGVAARASSAQTRTDQARTALRGAIRSVREVGERAGSVVRVADLATGRSADGDRIPLSTFVLMRRFEDVITAANARLALFSSADLELLRDTGARGARKTGLDLLVMDRRTDQVRVPETLSGGETFFVSLALALGLADIVTAEAGGVQMETLFIDEGFGSLDPETLETVIREIGRLAEHGRTIGIVSHVGDMKAQISEQIHVRRGPDRTSTATVTA
ncbi:SMC family ATPase [Brachybacterium sp. JHP9]|uniref:Nuclease SbcCD subunit C n=1 Tax=Brachybacterium equifaecis TaxID=2910770 RepID=A0ABT0R115_9MICO|nr:SMC family ATPase [Brachybacterium equifaecis]MCL6423098.1 SMC family ATPase [Brachybacterium equifaecis]